MKKLIIPAVAALGLFLAGPSAMAADHNGHNQHDNNGKNGHNGNGGNGHDGDHDGNGHNGNGHDGDHDGNGHDGNGHNNNGHHAKVRVHVGGHSAVSIKFGRLHANIRAPKRFHWVTYRHPPGWYSHRWVFGERLPLAFYASTYWINDYGNFGLMAPEDGLVWVRVDNNALLIDRETGEVVRVVYDVFY